ncbi:MAG: hypothetical protein NPIRA05_08830 [Nitrospirales bacterium]|nr:MAG: hypothetical protein NPIRA05_08830 [Nitrospirales bacterium]
MLIVVHQAQGYVTAPVVLRADIAAGEPPRPIAQTEAIGLIAIGEHCIEMRITIHQPQGYTGGGICI